MAIKKKNNRNQIRVILWGKEIGTLTWAQDRQLAYFHFSEDYFREPYDLCPITHPKNEPETHFAIYGESLKSPDPDTRIYQGLPPFIADALPDAWGNAIFNEWFDAHKLPPSEKTPHAKLSFIGNRAMGALEFKPMMDPGFYEDKKIDLKELYEQSLSIEQSLSKKALRPEEADIEKIAALGTSPGGSRKKAIICIAPDGTIHSGKTDAPEGWKHCIIKFNTPNYSLSEIEKTYYDLATTAGIPMMPSSLMEIKGTQHFLTERFDRRNGEKIMMQTLAAINPSANTYEDLFQTCRKLGLNEKEISTLFRQTAFNFLMNNTDDHKKNFTFLMGKDGTWHLSPAYDLTFVISENGNAPETNHCMSLQGKLSGVDENDLLAFAEKNNIKNPSRIIKEIRNASTLFEEKARQNGVNAYYTEMISKRLDELGRPHQAGISKNETLKVSGHKISDVRIEMSMKGNLHVLANIDGKERRAVITPKKKDYEDSLKSGLDNIPAEQKKRTLKRIFKNILQQQTPGS